MLGRSSRSRNFFKKLVVNGVNNSKAAIQNDCLMRLYDADAELKAISSELDSFDGKKDPIRCNLLVNQLRTAQDKVISLLFQLMDECNCERASRDYRMKFPDEILLSEGSESLNGQIWFGAECLSAGSNILNHTKESTVLRPMAKSLTQHLDSLRNDLRDLVINGGGASRINSYLIKKMVTFDHIFATFEYEYVRTMLPIRTVAEIEKLQEVAVLFSETLIDCVKRNLIKQDDIDEFQPIVMIAIPRLAIVRGLLYKNENPIYTRHKSQMCSLFQPFHGPLHSIRKLLRGLSPNELLSLERMLANDQSGGDNSSDSNSKRRKSADKDNKNQEDDSLQQTNESDGCLCEHTSHASTSNTYSNVLMDGLQYPVGQKRSTSQGSEDVLADRVPSDTQQDYSSCVEVPASSSKTIANQSENSPVGSSSSPSSSSSLSSTTECKECIHKKPSDKQGIQVIKSKSECDESNCCLSPPESDAQLERLIADFGASIVGGQPADSEIQHQSNNTSSLVDRNSEQGKVSADKHDGSDDVSNSNTKTAAMQGGEVELEKLFQKQAQQLLHKLFVAISGVADQLQSNFASDLRFILRHIFSSEFIDEDEEEDDDEGNAVRGVYEDEGEYSNNNQSGSSSPIEQGIEAHEVANLIDLDSGYSVNDTYAVDQDMRFVAPASSNFSYMNNSGGSTDMSRYPPGTSIYVATAQPSNDSDAANSRAFQDHQNRDLNNGILDDLMRTGDQTELIFESRSSPNDTSIMDNAQHRQQLLHQHLQSVSRASRSSRAHRHAQIVNENHQSSQPGTERRSRHHGHGSRSRRQRGPPVWVPDQLVVQCSCCNVPFSWFRRRHHCRACGQIFCADCSKFTKNLNCWGYNGPVRVCESCYNQP